MKIHRPQWTSTIRNPAGQQAEKAKIQLGYAGIAGSMLQEHRVFNLPSFTEGHGGNRNGNSLHEAFLLYVDSAFSNLLVSFTSLMPL